MNGRRLVRVGLGSVMLLAMGAGAWSTGCIEDDDTPDITGTGDAGGSAVDSSAPSPGMDSGTTGADSATDSGKGGDGTTGMGTDSGGGTQDSGGPDSATVVDAGTPPLLSLVHAAPDVPAVRFCFGITPTGALAGSTAAPKTTGGLPFGAGGMLNAPPAEVASLVGLDLYLWAIPTSSINSAPTPDAGQDPGDCGLAINYPGAVLFQKIPKNTFQFNHSYVIAMDGCEDPTADGGEPACGSPATDGGTIAFPGGPVLGSLRLELIAMDNVTPVPSGAIGAQFIQLSPYLQAALPMGVVPALSSPGDAGASVDGAPPAPVYDYAPITASPVMYNGTYDGPPGSTSAQPPQAFTATSAAASDFTTAGIGLLIPFGDAGALVAPNPKLASISLVSVATATLGPPTDGGIRSPSDLFTAGQSYTFISVGNLNQAPGTSPTFFRVIALPSEP
jgi:hypothetical protein